MQELMDSPSRDGIATALRSTAVDLGSEKAGEETALLVRSRQGDDDAFAELVARYRAPVYSYLSRCGVDPSDRDDLFQEVFMSVLTAAHRFDAHQPLHPWIFTIVANSTRSYFRKRRIRQLVFAEPRTPRDPEPRATTPAGERRAVASQTLAWLERQIPQLPLRQREVLLLACVEHRPLKEIAETLGMPLNTIKTHLRRAPVSGMETGARPGSLRKRATSMNTICRQIQDTLATTGAQALRNDKEAQKHLADCSDCFAVLERLDDLDAIFEALPRIDAPDDMVERLLARRTSRALGTPPPVPRWFPSEWRPSLRWSLPLAGAAAAVVLVLLLPLTRPEVLGPESFEVARVEPGQSTPSSEQEPVPDQSKDEPLARETRRAGNRGADANALPESERPNEAGAATSRVGGEQERLGDLAELATEPEGQSFTGYYDNRRVDGDGSLVSNSESRDRQSVDEVDTFRADDALAPGQNAADNKVVGGVESTTGSATGPIDAQPVRVGGDTGIAPPERIEYVAPVFPDIAQNAGVQGVVLLDVRIAANGEVADIRVVQSIPLLDAAAIEAVRQWKYAPPIVDGVSMPVVMTVRVGFTTKGDPGAHALPVDPRESDLVAARHFLEERGRIEGLAFQPARGYWANTYVPGDPVLRGLHTTLVTPGSHDASHRVGQPFDRPGDSAVAVFIASDHSATRGPRRALVQVGLQAAPRHAGHRVAMRLAIVVDLRGPVGRELIDSVGAILESFAAARGPADRFSLIAAGHELMLSADEFRYGAINVALRDLREAGPHRPATHDLESAVRLAVRTVTAENEPPAVPGAGAVVLVTGQPLGPSTGAVEHIASRSAAAGIPVSVVGVGDGYDLDAIDRIVLAGQGNRRLLNGEGDAAALVDRELSASSRVAARALRLRIRLAPGVKLVEVIGSKRLGTSQAERVRETERRLDRELARSLGIESDRGEDEDGLQIIIPTFHVGDSHTILLDVVTPGPGPLADVTVRYKDLVFLRNGVARATTSLNRGEDLVGPLQANVLKNLLAHRLSETLERSARQLSRKQSAAALRTLVEARALLVGLHADVRELATDADLKSDLSMLQEYVDVLDADAETDRAYWSRSLRYAGLLKILPRPIA